MVQKQQAMKNRLKRVILSAAKNLWQPPGRDREREILRCAQNDMPEALFHG
ncbi:MAG TPA: hypothetical protein VFQ30_01200 [Ktedonobacteraceae bacterium]|nr:hypothetical protein [Ktedonobacteraceae bacterium]